MNINIEFFDTEPMENIITCLHFKMDKVIFFGQSDTMTVEARKITENALKEICGVKDVSFEELSMKDMDRVLKRITTVVGREEKQGGKCFFDLTGGADMLLVAMGMYSATHDTPMHRYDVATGEMKILNPKALHIDKSVAARRISLTIDDLVRLREAKIDYGMQKNFKENLSDPGLRRDVQAIWSVASGDMRGWNGFSATLKACKMPTDSQMQERLDREKLRKHAANNSALGSETAFLDYLKDLEKVHCIEDLSTHGEAITFRYKNASVRGCIMEAGSMLELHTYFDRLESGLYADCRIGTHLKWGDEANDSGYMVNNEIDVLLLKDFALTFISCKSGAVDQMALYELDTVAARFGGKYARKELVTAYPLERHHRQRAEEMGITVTCI